MLINSFEYFLHCELCRFTMTLSQLELFEVLDLPLPEAAKIQNLPTESANVTNMLQYSIPEGKLFYPEPFIASPSYLHSDLPFLHIFQY